MRSRAVQPGMLRVGEAKSMSRTETLRTALPKEIERCQELLIAYADIGPVAMLRAYHALKECK
jgi:hypothetical protein